MLFMFVLFLFLNEYINFKLKKMSISHLKKEIQIISNQSINQTGGIFFFFLN
jgi:hypothetical protein